MRAAVDCGETDRGEMKEETVGGMPVEESQAAMEARQYCLWSRAISFFMLVPVG